MSKKKSFFPFRRSAPMLHKSRTTCEYANTYDSNNTQLYWTKVPSNILICKKINEITCTNDLVNVALWLLTDKTYKSVQTNVYVLPDTFDEIKSLSNKNKKNNNNNSNKVNKYKLLSSKKHFQKIKLLKNNGDYRIGLTRQNSNNKSKKNYDFSNIDFMIVLGGDGTLLYLISLFKGRQTIPPILAFERGSLGFLTPYKFERYKEVINRIRDIKKANNICVRMRLMGRVWRHKKNMLNDEITRANENRDKICRVRRNSTKIKMSKTLRKLKEMNKNNDDRTDIENDAKIVDENMTPINPNSKTSNGYGNIDDEKSYQIVSDIDMTLLKTSTQFPEHECVTRIYHALNEVLIHRDNNASMMSGELYINGVKTTLIQSDGIIFSTPTGSTAYNISAGGCLISPSVPCIGITPICPHTLSFRPVILEESSIIHIKIPHNSRYNALVNFDGKNSTIMYKGDVLEILKSPFPVPTFKHDSFQTEWFTSLATKFNWNVRTEQKAFDSNNNYNNNNHDDI